LPKIALYVSAAVFALMAVIFSLVFVFDFDVIVGSTFYRPVNLLAVGIFLAVLAVWMFIASRDVQE
jgi:hypothetical protein